MDGTKVTSPAAQGGLRVGDVVKSIDGHKISDWGDLNDTLVMGSGRDFESGRRNTVFTIDRAGRTMELTVHLLSARATITCAESEFFLGMS